MPTKPKYTKRPYKRYRKRMSRKTPSSRWVNLLIRKQLGRVTETKIKQYSGQQPNSYIDIKHNVANFFHLNSTNLMPARGVGDNERVGDKITSGGYLVRLLLTQNINRPNVTYRFVIATAPADYVFAYNTFFDDITSCGMLDIVNKNQVRIHKQYWIKPNKSGFFTGNGLSTNDPSSATSGGAEMSYIFKKWIPYKKIVKFPTGTLDHNDRKLIACLLAYDNAKTAGATSIGYCQLYISHYYKDA